MSNTTPVTAVAAGEQKTWIVESRALDELTEQEDEFTDLEKACLHAQGIEEDGGSATVFADDGTEIDHWDGYQLSLIVDGDRVAIAFPLKT